MVIDHSFIDLQKLSFCISYNFTVWENYLLRLEDTVHVFLRIMFEFIPLFHKRSGKPQRHNILYCIRKHVIFDKEGANTVVPQTTVKPILRKKSRDIFL